MIVITLDSNKDYKVRKFDHMTALKKYLSHRHLYIKHSGTQVFKGISFLAFTVYSRDKDVTPRFKTLLVERQ